MLKVFDNHPVVGLAVGSVLLAGSLLASWYSGSLIGEALTGMFARK